jgi:hypothetical protein
VDYIIRILASADDLARSGLINPALVTAWAGLEAVMRRRLRLAGEADGNGMQPEVMLNILTSAGVLSREEFTRLEKAFEQTSLVSHGFEPSAVEPRTVPLLIQTAQRLLEETTAAKQPA